MIGAGYDAFVVYGTAPKQITTKDESLMECPFSLEINDDEENADPEYDEDEKMMIEEKKDSVTAIEDYKVDIQKPPVSKFDEDIKKKERDAELLKIKLETEIDDDEPDYIKADEHGRNRKHCWVYI